MCQTICSGWPASGDGTAGADPGLTAVELFAAIGRGEVKAVWIMGTNPVVSLLTATR
ncbi:hypothetical protein KPZU09_05050 [Klebsiella pneumoniae]|uniref:Formate dehydrogenase n=1 Tax=Klebsiella pneumoniae TaxID=573 RepID=A0A919HLL0_KLEPN|nr:hypothetical protein KPZU09_05050 [Klebsiella pneumoniae]